MRSRYIGVLLAAATLLATILTGSASADTSARAGGTTTTASHHHGWTKLALTVFSRRGHDTTVLLECQPPDGTHPHPRRACRELKFAHGDFDNLPGSPEQTSCTMEFRPVVASVRGLWRGEWVRWHHRYSNPCTMRAETGAVFDF